MYDLETQHAVNFVRIVLNGDSTPMAHELHEGESAMIGHAAGCQLRVEDGSFPPHQCLIELRDGALWLHNWSGNDSTRVNGMSAEEEVVLALGDRVEFGDYWITFDRESAENMSDQEHLSCLAAEETSDVGKAEAATKVEIASVPNEVVSVEDSTMALLHDEIASLQGEIEERDSTIDELTKEAARQTEAAGNKSDVPSKRLEDLLFELQVGDERISNLELELQALEELLAAQSEEKQQIEAWVNDIEQRIARKEGETEAELEVLRSRLEREKQDRVTSQQQADKSLCGSDIATSSQIHDSLTVLRRDHESLREKHQESLERCVELEKTCAALRQSNTEAAIETRINEALRFERLQISQERAAISRKDHDIQEKFRQIEVQLAIENQTRTSKPSKEADERFRAFRDRLKELHHEEQAEHVAPSMGQRLVKLWQRLDGPTDTD